MPKTKVLIIDPHYADVRSAATAIERNKGFPVGTFHVVHEETTLRTGKQNEVPDPRVFEKLRKAVVREKPLIIVFGAKHSSAAKDQGVPLALFRQVDRFMHLRSCASIQMIIVVAEGPTGRPNELNANIIVLDQGDDRLYSLTKIRNTSPVALWPTILENVTSVGEDLLR